jgi:hypothetical protein
MSTIISVDGDGFWATIKTEIGEIEWSYESSSKCCERFGTTMSQPLSFLTNRKFINISFDDSNRGSATLTLKLEKEEDEELYFPREKLYEFLETNKDNMISTKNLINFCDSLDSNTWTIEFYNYHNGYYSHNLDVKIDGLTKWNLSL